MARGKFNKRGGGSRVDAISADEIEQRNQRLAEFEEARTTRRAEAEEEEAAAAQSGADGAGAKDEGKKGGDDQKVGKKDEKDPSAPVVVTSVEQHKKNLSKLEAVKKRRAVAEARRKVEEEAELAVEMERKARFKEAEADMEDDKKKKKKSKDKSLPKLTKIEIKKMKPAQMKDALKERGLEIQGNKNELTARLVEYEGKR